MFLYLDIHHIINADNLDAASQVMLAPTGGKGKQLRARIDQYRQDPRYQNFEIFLDGDRYAIVARPKVR